LLIMRHILLRQNKFVKLRSLRFGEAWRMKKTKTKNWMIWWKN
jgi:hypothetical protein